MTLAEDSRGRRSLRDLLHAALDQPIEERGAFVAARLPEGEELDEALALLARVEEVAGFLERPLTASPPVYRPALLERIGSYKIERLLGYGSMGVVYLARQSAPERQVALKLLRVDQASATSVDRFRREATVLARLSHPGIAQVFEAGVADLGAGEQPWFAMEYVAGESLTEHARSTRLDRRARVALIAEIARTVQHAHEHGVVHRDLKPENVLVERVGAGSGPRARVLDFGVAQLATDGDALATLTATGQVVGTLAYMAPEQARGGVVDARADQFALGAILYELLTGELPFAVRGKLVHDALRIVADGQWTSPTQHDKSLAGDLSAILGMALAPEPNRRYPSVSALADDLERWLAGRPTLARPRARAEFLARLVRKHPLATMGMMLAVAVVGVLSAYFWQMRADQARSSAIVQLLSDRALYDELALDVELLWPADSARVSLIDVWLADACGLQSRVEEHRTTIASLATRGRAAPSEFAADVAPQRSGRRWEDVLTPLERPAGLEGLLATMQARRASAARLFAATVTERLEVWAQAAARVERDARFAGYVLAPDEGLVPLGPDPRSGLEEFAALATGALPARDPVTGEVRPRIGDALTFVLVPGGVRWIGYQNADPTYPNYWPEHQLLYFYAWGPPFDVKLSPFLISKFEFTQDQWERLFGFNPSYNSIGKDLHQQGRTTPLHPMESITWERLMQLLPRYGMTLPTEAQWEVAARGDSPFAYVFGPTARDLIGCANLNTFNGVSHATGRPFPPDGYTDHAPIGTYEPNPFGLYDVIGNVWEYCLDDYRVHYHELEHRPGDGLVLGGTPDGEKARRGGDNQLDPTLVSVFSRSERLEHAADSVSGVRPAWPQRGARSTDLGQQRAAESRPTDQRPPDVPFESRSMTDQQPDGPTAASQRGEGFVDEVYDALRGIARAALARLPGRLEPTDLVHQAWVGLAGKWQGLPRAEFFALCATVMRRIAVDEARRIGARRDEPERVTFSGLASEEPLEPAIDLLDLDEALQQLAQVDARWARIVELRYFGGLTGDEVAEVLGLSRKTVVRDWALARAWLKKQLAD